MATMLNVYNLNRKKTAVLQNAYDVVETHQLNQIYTLSFSLPANDPKAQYCLPRHYVRYGDKGELYRIIKPTYSEDNVSVIKYDCEHVITTLCDNVMFGSYTYGGAGVRTVAVITWLLNQQKTKNWKLGVCEFDRKFEYGWEQENLLNALYSIPKEFAQPYQWTFDTTSYPWTVNLKKLDITAKPQYYLRAKRNILSSGNAQDYSEICTRIYPLGYGEGVNQLGITEATVNAQGEDDENGTRWGKTYIESPQSIIGQYGIIEKVLVDRRFENANSLYAYAKTMLEAYQTPGMSRSFDVTDLYQLTNDAIDKAEVGYITKLTGDGTITYITKTVRNWDIAGDLQIDLSTKATDIASSIADLADRVRIESVYSQGATQLYQHSKDANATPTKGMVMSLYFPSEMRQINKVLLRLKLNRFRSYSQTTDAGGASTRTSSEGGATQVTSMNGGATTRTSSEGGASTQTSSAGGAYTQTTESGGSSTQTSSSGGGTGTSGASTDSSGLSGSVTSDEVWKYGDIPAAFTGAMTYERDQDTGDSTRYSTETGNGVTDTPEPYSGGDGHYHYFYRPYHHYHTLEKIVIPSLSLDKRQLSHNHTVSLSGVGSHSHTFSIGTHTHSVNIPSHSHGLNIPNHTHTVSIPNHTHTVSIPNHTHKVNIPNHTHTVSIPNHTHNISAGIFESGNATAFDIYVGNTKKATVNSTSYDGDITQWLLNNKNQIPRGQWIDVEFRPNDLAYVVSSVFVQGFVQSRGGGNY